jgi:hypothetical protein
MKPALVIKSSLHDGILNGFDIAVGAKQARHEQRNGIVVFGANRKG